MQFCMMKQTISTILPNVIMDIEKLSFDIQIQACFLKKLLC